MNVYYTHELYEDDEQEEQDKLNPALAKALSEKAVIDFFEKLRAFVKQRLGVLKDEMDREELLNPSWVLLNLPNHELPNSGIVFINYSDNLKIKMAPCITQDDIDFFWDQNYDDSLNLF